MVEEIIINGVHVDLKPDSHLSIKISSNILKKVSDLTASYSYTYDLPKTAKNEGLFRFPDVIGKSGKKVRQYLDAEYILDGCKIFDGKCYVSEVSADSFSVCFLFGIFNQLQQMKDDDTKLNTLFNDADNDYYGEREDIDILRTLPVDDISKVQSYPLTSMPDCLCLALPNDLQSSGTKFTLSYAQYCVPIYKTIFGQINNRYGISIEGLQESNETGINEPLFQWKYSTRKVGHFIFRNYGQRYDTLQGFTAIIYNEGFENTIKPDIFDLDGDHKDVEWINDYVPGFHCPLTFTKVKFIANGKEGSKIGNLHLTINRETQEDYDLGDFGTIDSTTQKTVELDLEELGVDGSLKENKGWIFVFSQADTNVVFQFYVEGYVNSDSQDEEGYFNLFDTMPETSVMDFISDFALTTYGKFPINTMKNDGAIHFTSLEEIADNTPVDWTNKLISGAAKFTYTRSGLAERNWIRYAEEESEFVYTIKHHFDVNFPTDDSTLSDEADYHQSNFSKQFKHADGNYWYITRDSVNSQDKSPAPRILSYLNSKAASIDSKNYCLASGKSTWQSRGMDSTFLATMKTPTMLECDCLLTALDLAHLDMTRPVYFAQYGALFFIEEVNFNNGKKAQVKLMEIKKS